jgi:DNA-binding ferritin-like protein
MKGTKSLKQRGTPRPRGRTASKRSLASFENEITVKFLEILLMTKLFHWKTFSYAIHKATDELYTKLNSNIDTFIEVLLGKSGGIRMNLMHQRSIRLMDLNSNEALKKKIDEFKAYLVDLENRKELQSMSNTDLFNIRDALLGDLNQFLYLLTFK